MGLVYLTSKYGSPESQWLIIMVFVQGISPMMEKTHLIIYIIIELANLLGYCSWWRCNSQGLAKCHSHT